jgi:5-methylcytosine-specific restriction endonuclease McrA
MPGDPFYKTDEWQNLRASALKRDKHTCTVRGCHHRAFVVDHIVSRARRGADALPNLRSLCRMHDNQTKEDAQGKRRSNGKMTVTGCDANGMPLDPSHWWMKG